MKVKNYEQFVSEEIDLRKAIGGAALAGSLISSPAAAGEPVKPTSGNDSIVVANQDSKATVDFVKEIELERPELFNDELTNTIEFGKFEKLSFLHDKVMQYQQDKGVNLNMDLLSHRSSGLPFRINYFYVRGLDDVDKGPFLIRIVNVDFTKAITLAGHEIHFNFTRLPDVTTFGTRINF